MGNNPRMSASPMPGNACSSCGEELGSSARFCPNCGTPVEPAGAPPLETVPGPVVRGRVEARWLGMPARFLLLCLGFAGLGAAIGLFATGSWVWGIVALLLAAILLAALWEATRRAEGDPWTAQSSRLAADGRAHAATAAEVWRTRLDATVTRWRTQSRLDQIEIDRGPALQRLGEAVWRDDSGAEEEARQRLVELEEERQRMEDELAERLAGAEERIRQARLPVQDTLMVTPNEPSAPYPPPDEGNPPEPAQVPEPYPPPDEGTPPVPAPDPGQPESE
jgi:zinc-ribbon domain